MIIEIDCDTQSLTSDIDRALKIAARVVVLYGDRYLPVFERMRVEVSRAKEKIDTKNLAIELAKKIASIEETG
jgi:hypothetical protein